MRAYNVNETFSVSYCPSTGFMAYAGFNDAYLSVTLAESDLPDIWYTPKMTVKFVSRQFNIHSVLNGTYDDDAYDMQLESAYIQPTHK